MYKLAILVPYRDRRKQLDVFLPHMEKFLSNKDIEYKICILEQADDRPFNRGKLLNIGFDLLKDEYDYFCFHDVSLLPINDSCDYSYVDVPTHLATIINEYDNELPYPEFTGGVFLINKENFKTINGFSNEYWGWGLEDLDLLHRMRKHNLDLEQYYETSGITKSARYNIDEIYLSNILRYRTISTVKFDGKSYMRLPINNLNDNLTNGNYTISTWVKPEKGGFIFSRAGEHTGLEYKNGEFRANIWSTSNHYMSAKREPNFWYHLVMRVIDGVVKLRINGVEIEDRLNKNHADILKKYDTEYFIGTGHATGENFVGLIGETVIWNEALPDEECDLIYLDGIQGVRRPLSYWSFKMGYNNLIFDEVKYNNLELHNFDIKNCLEDIQIRIGEKLLIPARKSGIYTMLSQTEEVNIVNKMIRGEYGDIIDPDIEINKDIFFNEVRSGDIDINVIGLNSLEYKIGNRKLHTNKSEWIQIIT